VRDAEKTIIPALRDHKMRLLPYSPLASGLLSGKYRGGAIPTGSRLDRMQFIKGFLPKNLEAIDGLQAIADGRGIKLAQLAIAWLAGIRLSVAWSPARQAPSKSCKTRRRVVSR
jgi:aryl-alcohol dehydrogenase-like predicted oxidoreductase